MTETLLNVMLQSAPRGAPPTPQSQGLEIAMFNPEERGTAAPKGRRGNDGREPYRYLNRPQPRSEGSLSERKQLAPFRHATQQML